MDEPKTSVFPAFGLLLFMALLLSSLIVIDGGQGAPGATQQSAKPSSVVIEKCAEEQKGLIGWFHEASRVGRELIDSI